MKVDEKIRCILKYGWYLNKHRFFVMMACFKRGMFWRGLVHDLSKYGSKEFLQYAYHFYKDKRPKRDSTGYYKPTDTGNLVFEMAWLHHVHNNKHHWQYFCIPVNLNENKFYDMPDRYIKEMICDWRGAHRAQNTEGTIKDWYYKNKYKLCFSTNTRKRIEELLDINW